MLLSVSFWVTVLNITFSSYLPSFLPHDSTPPLLFLLLSPHLFSILVLWLPGKLILTTFPFSGERMRQNDWTLFLWRRLSLCLFLYKNVFYIYIFKRWLRCLWPMLHYETPELNGAADLCALTAASLFYFYFGLVTASLDRSERWQEMGWEGGRGDDTQQKDVVRPRTPRCCDEDTASVRGARALPTELLGRPKHEF